MTAKEIVPVIELDSNEFEKKVLYSLEQAGSVRIVPKMLSGREEDLNKFAFALMNTQSSKRKLCLACGSKHRYFVRGSDFENKDDETCLCDSCGVFLTNLVLFEVPQEQIIEWIKSEGKIDPYDLMRDAISEGVKKGDIKMETEER